MKGIVYQGVRLVPGSRAHQLHTEGRLQELAKHMRQLHDEGVKRGEFRC